jgi:hypothetical protein
VNRDACGAVAGRVLDDEGKPLPGVRVFTGFQEARPDAQGRFRFDGVPAGTVPVTAQRFGYRPWRADVEVPAGGEGRVEIALAPLTDGGNELEGKVVDTDGVPVAGVRVWVGGAADLSRDATTDAQGVFRFRRLPDLGSRRVSVSVMVNPETAGVLPATVQNVPVPSPGLVLTVERSVMLRLVVRDAETEAPLPLFNVSLERERIVDGQPRTVRFRSASAYEEDGTWEAPVPRDRIVLFVEAPDRQPVHGFVLVPAGEGVFEVLVEMSR